MQGLSAGFFCGGGGREGESACGQRWREGQRGRSSPYVRMGGGVMFQGGCNLKVFFFVQPLRRVDGGTRFGAGVGCVGEILSTMEVKGMRTIYDVFRLRLARCVAALLLLLVPTLSLHGQTTVPMTPKAVEDQLANFAATASCSGYRFVGFEGDKIAGKKLRFRVYVWNGSGQWKAVGGGADYFKLYNVSGGSRNLETGGNLIAQLNTEQNYRDVPGTPWRYCEVEMGPGIFQSGYNYELVNEGNVFHVGYLDLAGGSAPTNPTVTQFQMSGDVVAYNTADLQKITYRYRGRLRGGWQEVPDGTDALKLCANDSVLMNVAVFTDANGTPTSNDRFNYSWEGTGAIGIRTPDSVESYVVKAQTGATLTIKRTGMCDYVATGRTLKVTAVQGLVPTLQGNGYLCDEKDNLELDLVGAKGAEVSWQIRYHGSAQGDYQSYESKVPKKVVGSDREHYSVPLTYGTSIGTITHSLRVVAKVGACEVMNVKEVKMYPQFNQPKIELTAEDPSITDPTAQPVCAPFKLKMARDMGNPSQVSGVNYLWNLRGQQVPVVDKLDNIAPFETTMTDRIEEVRISLELSVENKNCTKRDEKIIQLMPSAPAQGIVEFYDQQGSKTESRCAPLKIVATCETEKSASSTGTATPQYKWTYSYEGDTNPDGTLKETVWGTSKSVTAPESVPSTGLYYFREYKANATNPKAPYKSMLRLDYVNEFGCVSSREFDLRLMPAPEVKEVKLTQAAGCSPLKLTASAVDVIRGGTYEWTVLDGAMPVAVSSPGGQTGVLPTTALTTQQWKDFVITNAGQAGQAYTVRFTVRHPESSCSAMAENTLTVSPEVNLELGFDDLEVCPTREGKAAILLTDNTTYPAGMTHKWQRRYEDTPGVYQYDDVTPTAGATAGQWIFEAENFDSADKVRKGWIRIVADAGGVCETKDSLGFTVYPRVNPQIKSASIKAGTGVGTNLADGQGYCAPFVGNFQGSGADELMWHFDAKSLRGMQVLKDAAGGVDFSFVNREQLVENMRVSLVGTNAYQCKDSVTVRYDIKPSVTLDFSVKTLEKCNPVKVSLERHVEGGGWLQESDFLWDGKSSTSNPMEKEYTTPGTQTITLSLQNNQTRDGCHVDPKSYTLSVPEQVVAKLAGLAAKAYCAGPGNEVTFTNSSLGSATQYIWDFGDGKEKVVKSDKSDVKHVFENTGSDAIKRRVTLTAIDAATGCTDVSDGSDGIDVTIYPQAIPRMKLTLVDQCVPRKVRVVDAGSTGCDRYDVTFTSPGSGATAIKDTWPPRTTQKEYDLTNTDPLMPVTYAGSVVGYKEWPDGTRCQSKPISLGSNITVDPSFTSELTVSADHVCAGTPLQFSANSSLSGIVYEWSFADAPFVQLPSPVDRVFANDGKVDRIVSVKVRARRDTDGTGMCAQTVEKQITVHPKVQALIVPKYADRCVWPTRIEFTNQSQCADPATSTAKTAFTWNYVNSEGDHEVTKSTLDNQVWDFKPDSDDSPSKYTVTLDASQTYVVGSVTQVCRDAASVEVEVYPKLVPDFTMSVAQGCAPLKIHLEDKSVGGKDLRKRWTFDDGSGELEGASVDRTFNNATPAAKTHKVTLTVMNEFGCTKSSLPKTVTVFPEVKAAFNMKVPSPECPPYDLTFENVSTNAAIYSWECLAGGASGFPQSAMVPSPVRIENKGTTAKTYTFKLTASNDYGGANGTCSDEVEKTLTVRPELNVKADPPVSVGCSPLEVHFTGSVTGADTDVPFWDFGDGTTKSASDVKKKFENSSREKDTTFNVTVSAAYGQCVTKVPIQVTVYPKVEAMFGASATDGCTPLVVTVSSVAASSRYSYEWSAVGSDKPSSTVANPGKFTYENKTSPLAVMNEKLSLKVKLTDHPECVSAPMEIPVVVYPGIAPSFTIDPAGCSPFTPAVQNLTSSVSALTAYTWKFYTGGVKTIELKGPQPAPQLTNPSHDVQQDYEVWLVAQSEHGCLDSVLQGITVWPKPLVALELGGANESCPPYNAKFINKSLGTSLKFTYSFGDGHEETHTDFSSVTHAYDNTDIAPRIYTMKLTGENTFGCKDEKVTTITIYSNPKADFEIQEGYESCSPFLVSMIDKSNNGVNYQWSFGDGRESTMPSPIHQFENLTSSDKVYDVKLHVETGDGCADEITRKVTVFATPVAEFSAEPPLQVYHKPSVPVTFGDMTQPTSSSWTYSWDFGDGSTTSTHNPGEYHYTNWAPRDSAFAYTVRLKVKSPKCESSAQRQVFILAPTPSPFFEATAYGGCAPFHLYLENHTEYMDSCLWDFGDGTTSREAEPMHRYEVPSLYHVTLKAWGEGGEASAYRIVEVYENPKPMFEILPKEVMLPTARVKANNLSEGISESFWDFGDGFTSTEHSPMHHYSRAGEYPISLRVRSSQGCLGDTIINPAVIVLDEGRLLFPSAFRPSTAGPNGGAYPEYDMTNEVFHPVWSGVVRYKLMIFNRWGEKLFESNDIKVGWDGYFAGKICMTGVYVWRAVGEYYNGKMFDMRGNVTLLR